MLGVDLSDLGLGPVVSAVTENDAETVENVDVSVERDALQVGSLLARVLYSLYSGRQITLVESPPGAGKSTLIGQVLRDILTRDNDWTVAVACPTRRGAYDLAARMVGEFSQIPEDVRPHVIWSVTGEEGPAGSVSAAPIRARSVVVRTTASCAFSPPPVNLLIFDEAYQTTFADASEAAKRAEQILMVGDPGQIGPVVTVPTSFWSGAHVDPSRRAPEQYARMAGAQILHLDATYRVGQETVDVIAPLYGFPFTSRRPDRWVTDSTGERIPEIVSEKIDLVENRADLDLLRSVVTRVLSYIGQKSIDVDPVTGEHTVETIQPSDIAVVVPHNDQVTALTALLRSVDHPLFTASQDGTKVAVNTADRAQGGQWKIVIALDPTLGMAQAGSHQLSLGRLCVMLSRHTHTLTWIHDGSWAEKFAEIADAPDNSPADTDAAKRSIAVRRLVTRSHQEAIDHEVIESELAGFAAERANNDGYVRPF